MFTRKNKLSLPLRGNYLWAVNLILFVGVVFLGIEQAGRGAQISDLENKIEDAVTLKRDLSEEIFSNESETKIAGNIESLGFVKPENIHYFNSENVFASLTAR
jgi:cell division protein FtsL